MVHKKPTTWNDIEHDSRDAAADANYVTTAALRWRLKQGYTCDADMDCYISTGNPVIYQGTYYRSLSRCAKVHCVTDYMMQKLIKLEQVTNAKTE